MSRPSPPRPSPPRRGLLPHPWLAAWLWIGWLLLNQTLAPSHVLLGALLAWAIARVTPGAALPVPRAVGTATGATTGATTGAKAGRGARRPVLRRAAAALRLSAVVLWDIVVANVQVAAKIVGPQAGLRPDFVLIPLDATQPRAITLLAGIVTMTPGTLSAELTDDRRHLLVHALDLDDRDELVAQVKSRYERPVMEILE